MTRSSNATGPGRAPETVRAVDVQRELPVPARSRIDGPLDPDTAESAISRREQRQR
jgi:hypothetical protein